MNSFVNEMWTVGSGIFWVTVDGVDWGLKLNSKLIHFLKIFI